MELREFMIKVVGELSQQIIGLSSSVQHNRHDHMSGLVNNSTFPYNDDGHIHDQYAHNHDYDFVDEGVHDNHFSHMKIEFP